MMLYSLSAGVPLELNFENFGGNSLRQSYHRRCSKSNCSIFKSSRRQPISKIKKHTHSPLQQPLLPVPSPKNPSLHP
jgi:hypothetical protein